VPPHHNNQQRVFNSNRTASGVNPSTFISSETGRTASSPSYGYTSGKNAAPKYSPIRNARPGANNVPMSYAGPPTQAEINRNQGRLHHANAFSKEHQQHQPSAYSHYEQQENVNMMNRSHDE
jgi:hypothetical protein